ncbi:MAG: hypothetical protein QXV23_07310 [Candidatus Bathyarchaeia archaeon]
MRGKMVGLFAAVLIAIMVAGLAYAHWSETLVISGTVNTGKLDLELSCTCSDNDDTSKDVADVTCVVQNETEPNSITISVTNAYPCYEVSGTIDIKNVGTVPAVLIDYDIDLPEDVILVDLGGYRYKLYYDADGDREADPEELMATAGLTIEGDIGQIDAGETVPIDFYVHFTNPGLPEDWSGTFTITLYFENWSPPT